MNYTYLTMVAALPFMCAGAKTYLPIVLQIFTTNLLSLPNISHDVEKEIFKGCGQTKKKDLFYARVCLVKLPLLGQGFT